MSITDSSEKINPVRDCEDTQRPSISNGVKQFIESDKGKDILVVIIVILVGLGSFELGRLSKETVSPGVKIQYSKQGSTGEIYQEANVVSGINSSADNLVKNLESSTITNKNFFGSKRGHKYYSLGCSAGKSIKAENRVYFATRENAEQAGYVLSTSCS